MTIKTLDFPKRKPLTALLRLRLGLRDYQDALVPFQETVTKADEVFVCQMAVGLDKVEAQKQLDTVRVRTM